MGLTGGRALHIAAATPCHPSTHTGNRTHHPIQYTTKLGLRPAGAIGLRWTDVDLAERRLAVRQTIQRIRTNPGAQRGQRSKLVIDETKTEAGTRVIDLPES